MFIELAEMLRCPQPHEETYLVVSTGVMKGRSVWLGTVGCPVCASEYPIVNGVVRFGIPEQPREPHQAADVDAIHAGLGIEGGGGFVVLVGTAARLAGELRARLEGVHFVGINAPPDQEESDTLTLMAADGTIPLRTQMARGCVIGADFAYAPWLDEAARITLHGRRIVALREGVTVANAEPLASGMGVWVGERS